MSETSNQFDDRDVNDGGDADDPESFGVGNATACMTSCRNIFTKGIGFNSSGDLKFFCQKLVDEKLSSRLKELYCCDSRYCGLGIIGHGSDPNVDWIISACSNLGINGITDPGPPEPSGCSQESDDSETSQTDGFSVAEASTGPTLLPHETGSLGLTATSSGLSITASPSTKVIPDSHSSDASNASSNDLNNAGKIAVGICSTIAAMAVIFIFWCLRRRKRSANGYMQTPPPMTRAFKAHYPEPSESHASLIITATPPPPPPPPSPPPVATASGTKSPQPLTPPMRLSDRRFLPSLSSPASVRSSSAPPYSSQPDLAIPEHPVLPAFTHNRNSPPYSSGSHYQETATTPSMDTKHTDVFNTHNSHQHNIPRSSLSSAGGGGGSETTLTLTSPSSPSSPSRPRRPHETPLLVPGLITPAGPPPVRALPAAPPPPPPITSPRSPPVSSSSLPILAAPVSPLSPTASPFMGKSTATTLVNRPVSPVVGGGPGSEIGLAIGMVREEDDETAAAVSAASSQANHDDARGSGGGVGSRQTRDSGWGIWMGNHSNHDGDPSTQRRQQQQQQEGHAERLPRSDDGNSDQIGVDIVLRELEMAKLSGGC